MDTKRATYRFKSLVLALVFALVPVAVVHADDRSYTLNVSDSCVASINNAASQSITVDKGTTLNLTIQNDSPDFGFSAGSPAYSGGASTHIDASGNQLFTVTITSATSFSFYPVGSDDPEADNYCSTEAPPKAAALLITVTRQIPTTTSTSDNRSVAAQGAAATPTPDTPKTTTSTPSGKKLGSTTKPADTVTKVTTTKSAPATSHTPLWLILIFAILVGVALWSIWSDKVLIKKLLKKIKLPHKKP
jgi:hypothetical protein